MKKLSKLGGKADSQWERKRRGQVRGIPKTQGAQSIASLGTPCPIRPLYLPPEKSVCRSRSNRTGHGTIDWFQIRKGVCQDCILSPCLFNFYAEYIMRNAGLEETQAGIQIAGRNINNLRYADDTTLMAESEEELKSLLMKVKEESEKVGLKLNIKKTYRWLTNT